MKSLVRAVKTSRGRGEPKSTNEGKPWPEKRERRNNINGGEGKRSTQAVGKTLAWNKETTPTPRQGA